MHRVKSMRVPTRSHVIKTYVNNCDGSQFCFFVSFGSRAEGLLRGGVEVLFRVGAEGLIRGGMICRKS
jgi:hypothetical protein